MVEKIVDKEIQELVALLDHDEEKILSKFHFTLEGKPLTEAESKRFIQFLKKELADHK